VSAEPPQPGTARPAAFGPETWAIVEEAEWCWWDLWFCVLAVADFGGDLGHLEADLVGRLRSPGWMGISGADVEAKLSHLADLRARLASAGSDAAALAALGKGPGVLSKARAKILKKSAYDSEMTSAMRDTPRRRLQRRARTGRWPSFPASPAPWYDKFRRTVEVRDVIGERRSMRLAGQLWDRLCRHAQTCQGPADELALYRAFHTAGLELADRADDGFGCVGDLRVDALTAYLDIDWVDAGMSDNAYWQDLCELLVWEPYALTHRDEGLPFRHATAGQADLIEGILLGLAEEHREVHLAYQADEALALVAWLHVAARRYRRYPAVAARLGSDRAGPIIALADSALRGHKADIAGQTFRAADRPGRDQVHLRQRCLELTGVRLDDEGT
jgi:hypothetical protein